MMQPKVKNKNKWMNKRQVLWIIWQKARRAGISASRCLDWGIRCRFPYAPVICEKNLWFLHFWKKYRHPWDRSWVLFGDWAVVCVNQELETRWQWGALASLSESRWHTDTRCSSPLPYKWHISGMWGPLVLRHNSRNWVKGRDLKITMYINIICVLYIYTT